MEKFRFEATIEEINLLEIFGLLSVHQVSGTLTVVFGNIVRKLFFTDGKIAYASSSTENDQLDRTLIKLGKLNPKHHRSLIRQLQAGGLKKANLLLENNIIKPSELVWLVRFQALGIIYDLLRLKSGKIDFEFGEADDPAVMRLNISTTDVVLDSIRYGMNQEQLDETLETNDTIIIRTQAFTEHLEHLNLTPGEILVAHLIDDNRSIIEICQLSPFDESVTKRLIIGLLVCKLCDQKPRTQSSSPASPPSAQ